MCNELFDIEILQGSVKGNKNAEHGRKIRSGLFAKKMAGAKTLKHLSEHTQIVFEADEISREETVKKPHIVCIFYLHHCTFNTLISKKSNRHTKKEREN